MSTERTKPLVGYIRVSTDQQHNSGLGEAAQLAALDAYAAREGTTFLRVFKEVETSKRSDLRNRPQLQAAIDLARLSRGVLVIAKLDRLVRNLHVLTGLMESGLDFVALDIPTVNRLVIHILAAVAEEEARQISRRTKEALAAKKSQGFKLGSPATSSLRNLTPESRRLGQLAGAKSKQAKAIQDLQGIVSIARPMRANGASLADIANHLNTEGYPTRGNGRWNASTVKRMLDRAQRAEQRI